LSPLQLENVRLNTVNREQQDEIEKLREQVKFLTNNQKGVTAASNYARVGDRRQRQIRQEEYERFDKAFGSSAPEVISELYNRFKAQDIPSFSPSLTGHIFQASGINLNKSRKLRHELFVHGAPSFLASERQVSEEKKRIRAGVEFEENYINLKVKASSKAEPRCVVTMKDPGGYIQRRLQQIIDNGLYRKIIHEGKEEAWIALTIDKGDARTIFGLVIGNTLKAINSRYNMSLIGIFEGDDSTFNLYAAFANLFEILGRFRTVFVTTAEGKLVELPVRCFYIGDYKSEKSVAGLMSGKPNYPSINCLSTTKQTYGELDFSKECIPRPPGFVAKLVFCTLK
jgi:hypothetical protein